MNLHSIEREKSIAKLPEWMEVGIHGFLNCYRNYRVRVYPDLTIRFTSNEGLWSIFMHDHIRGWVPAHYREDPNWMNRVEFVTHTTNPLEWSTNE